MIPLTSMRRPGTGLPTAAGLALVTLTLSAWWFAAARERDTVQAAVDAVADGVATRLSGEVEALRNDLERVALRFGSLNGIAESSTAADSTILLRDTRLTSVVWLDPEFDLFWRYDAGDKTRAIGLAPLRANPGDAGWTRAIDDGVTTVSRAYRDGNGTVFFLVTAPVSLESGLAALMVSVYDVRRLLAPVERELAGEFALVARLDGRALDETPDALGGLATDRWLSRTEARFDTFHLVLEIRPTQSALSRLQSNLPGVVLAAGLALSLLGAVAVRLGQVQGLRAQENVLRQQLEDEVLARERAERALERRALALERSNDDLVQFAHVISHDLRAPLNVIAMHNQLLAEKIREPEVDRHLQTSHRAVGRMTRMIDGLLAYSRVGGAGIADPVEVREIVARAIANLESEVAASGARIDLGELPLVVGSPDQLLQLFQNLIGNALQHRSDRAPVVHVGAVAQPAHWIFRVADNGPGISAERAETIFALFEGNGRTAGSGVGLAVCRRIVETRGGRIWVQPTAGGGSTFVFTWPREEIN